MSPHASLLPQPMLSAAPYGVGRSLLLRRHQRESDGPARREKRGGDRGQSMESPSVCLAPEPKAHAADYFSFMLVPGKRPIQIVPIGNGRVMATGGFLGPSLGATGDLCLLQEPPCVSTDTLSLGDQMSSSRMGLPQYLACYVVWPETGLDWSLEFSML